MHLFVILLFAVSELGPVRADDIPTYEKHIAPFFKAYCLGCHDGGDDSKGGLSLLTHKSLLAGGDGGEVIFPGKSDDSRLVQMLLGTEQPKMPPKDARQPKAHEIALVKRWVDLGAKPPAVTLPQSADELTLPKIAPKVKVAPAIAAVRYSADGRWLAAARHRDVLLVDAATGAIARTLTGAENPINAVAFSPDGRFVAAAEGLASVVGKVRLWELADGEKSITTGDPAGNGTNDSKLRTTHSAFRTLTAHTDSIYALAFSPDGAQLATASYDKLLILWDVASGSARHTLKHHTAAVFGLAFSSDGQALASVSADQTVKLWNVATGQRILTLTEPTKSLNAVAFHPQGRELAAAGSDKMIRLYVWNGTTAKLKRSAFAHDAAVLALAYSPDGATLYSAGEDRRIKAWDAAALQERHVYDRLSDWPLALAVHPAGDQLAAGLYNGKLLILNARSPKQLRAVEFARAVSGIQDSGFGIQGTVAFPPLGRGGQGGSRGTNPTIVSRRDLPGGSLSPTYGVIVAAALGQLQATAPVADESKPNPPTPRFDSVSPRTVVRGQKVKFTLSGQNIATADRVFVSKGDLKATLLPADPKNDNQAFCEIEIPADVSVGNISLRLHTPLGTAGTRSFYVGPFAETNENESNDTRAKSTPAKLPATLAGTIDRRGDRDVWSFDAKAGEQLVFVLVAPTLGSALQGRLTVSDKSGRLLQTAVRQPERREVVVGHKFESSGRFFLQVEDRDNSGGGNHFYRVHAGSFPYVTGVWPLGMRASEQGQSAPGEVTSIDVAGFNLLPGTKFRPIPGASTRHIFPFTPIGKSLSAARYEASPFPEFAEQEPNDSPAQAQPLPIPSAVSGRIAGEDSGFGIQDSGEGSTPFLGTGGAGRVAPQEASERKVATENYNRTAPARSTPHSERRTLRSSRALSPDHYSFTAKQGDWLTIETIANRLGSPVDTVIEILDAEGKPVPRNTLRAVAETYIVLRDHDSRGKGIRLQNWDDLQPNDFVMVGGEVLKVQSLPLGPDADVQFADRSGRRVGWFGTTPEAHAINTAAFKVEIHPPGATFPPNGMPVVPLDWRNDDAPGLGTDSEVLFDVPADGTYIVRVRDVRELAGDDFVYRLAIRPRREDFRISLDPENPNVPRGGSLPVTVTLDRLEGFSGPVEVRIEGLPEGISATTTRIGPHQFSGILTLTAATEPPAVTLATRMQDSPTIRAIGRAVIAGQPVEHSTSPEFGDHHVTVTSPPDIRITVEPSFAEIAPGQELRFTATIERRNAFKGRVPVEVLNLPHGLRVLDVGLNGVLINETETSRSFVVTCDPWAEPGAVQFYAAAKVESKNERHASSVLRLEVKRVEVVGE